MATYQEIIYQLESYGFTDVLLPFLLIFTIIFAVLEKSEILGKDKRNFSVVVALVIALTVVIPHTTGDYPQGYDAVEIINSALPSISLLAIAAISFLIIVGVFGAQTKWIGASLSGWMAILAFIAIVVVFGSAAGWGDFYVSDYIDDDTLTLVIIILVFAILVWYITAEPGKGEKTKVLDRIRDVGEYFGGAK